MDNNNDCNIAGGCFFSRRNRLKADKSNMGDGQPKRCNYEQYYEYIYRNRTYLDFGGCHRLDSGFYDNAEGFLT